MPFQGIFVDASGYDPSLRTTVELTATNFTGVAADTLISLTPVIGGNPATAVTSWTIPSGKRFALVSLTVSHRNSTTAAEGIVVRLVVNTAGAALATSTVIGIAACGTFSAIANVSAEGYTSFGQASPSDFYLTGNGTLSIGIVGNGTAVAGNDVALTGYLY